MVTFLGSVHDRLLGSVHSRVQMALAVALLVSVACNVLAAEPSVVGRAVAAWPPVALFLTVDVVGRVPRASGWLGLLQWLAIAAVATPAGVSSFLHMHEVALSYGESEYVAWLFPFTVDGLAVVCSIGLFRLSRIGDDAAEPTPVELASEPEPFPSAEPDPVSVVSVVSSVESPDVQGVARSPQSVSVRGLTPVFNHK